MACGAEILRMQPPGFARNGNAAFANEAGHPVPVLRVSHHRERRPVGGEYRDLIWAKAQNQNGIETAQPLSRRGNHSDTAFVAPGQFAAWYDGEELVGSGVID